MLNILFLTENFKDTVRQDALYYLEQEVGKGANCRWAGLGWSKFELNEPMDETVKRVMPNADWVIYFHFGYIFRRLPTDFPPKAERRYKVATYLVDLHRDPAKLVREFNNSELDALLMTTIRLEKQLVNNLISPIPPNYYIDNLEIPFFHMAPCINPRIYKPTPGKKEFDVAFLGNIVPPHYPLRHRMWKELRPLAGKERWKLLIQISPPGLALDKKISRLKTEHLVGEKYADALGRSKIFLFGTSIYRYPLMKFYEGMACGACVMADIPLSAEGLHLIPGQNFVDIDVPDWVINRTSDNDDWREKLRYYLRHDDEREEIAQRGYEMVMKYHTAEVRAMQLVRFLEQEG